MYYYRKTGTSWLKAIAAIALIAVIIVTIIYANVKKYELVKQCEDNGGRWIKYNCRDNTSTECTMSSHGSRTDCQTTNYEVCDEKCVGARAEEGR